MRTHHPWRRLPLLLAATALPFLLVACGDDDDPTDPDSEATLIGDWVVTSLTAPSQPQWGDAVTDDGLDIRWTFTSGGQYSGSVLGDYPDDPWLCNFTASCTWSGSYDVSGSTIIFDQGTVDEIEASFSVTSTRLTLMFEASPEITDPYRLIMRRD